MRKIYRVEVEYGENEEPLTQEEIKEGLDWIDVDAVFSVTEITE
jgi:hypothetical protein